jgi:hypothetical protein
MSQVSIKSQMEAVQSNLCRQAVPLDVGRGDNLDEASDKFHRATIHIFTKPRQDAPMLQPGEEWRVPYEAAWEGLSCPYRTPIL